jgi:hypothetical protein
VFAQHRDEFVEHHRAGVLAGRPFVPVASAAVDRDDRDRRHTQLRRLRQTLLDTACHDVGGAAALAVQRDDRAQRAGLAGWARDRPIRRDSAAGRRHERTADVGRCRGGRRRHPHSDCPRGHADAETHQRAPTQFWHGGHHAIGGHA